MIDVLQQNTNKEQKQVAQRATIAHIRINVLFILMFQALRGSYLRNSYGIWLKFELIRGIMVVILIAKNDDLITNKGA